MRFGLNQLRFWVISLLCAGIFFSGTAFAEITGTVNILTNVPHGLLPETPPSTGFVVPNQQPFSIYDVLIQNITIDSAVIKWQTDQLATSEIYFGETSAYELGVQSGLSFLFQHEIHLTNLKPRTTYHFLISSRSVSGATALAGDFTFTTLSLPDHRPPASIRDFQIFPADGQLTLVWQNPPDPDFAGVKIYRSLNFYPTVNRGELIFQGLASSLVDPKLINDQRYYYTIYAYDWASNLSGGVSQSGVPRLKVIPQPGFPTEPVIKPEAPKGEEIPAWLFQYLVSGSLTLQLSQEGFIEVLAYDQITLNIPAQIFSRPIDHATLRLRDASSTAVWIYPLNWLNNGKLLAIDFIAPPVSGRYQAEVEIVFTDQSRAYAEFTVTVFPRGYLRNGWLPNTLIKGAVILLYAWQPATKEWLLYPSSNSWQTNPQISPTMGEYGWSVPNGRYYLVIHKEGYWTKITKPFTVSNHRINFGFKLWPIVPFWWVIVLAILFSLWQFLRKLQYQSLLKKIKLERIEE